MNTHSKNSIMASIKRIERAFSQIGKNAYVDWSIIFTSGIVLGLVFLSFGVYVYRQVNNGDLVTVNKAKPNAAITIDRKALADIITYFEVKKATFEDLKTNPQAAVDPSI